MPKKKINHKGKPKHAAEESEELSFRKNNENVEEEYTTVVDYETNKKYNKRLILNNWSKYEASLSDFECGDEETDSPKTEDFNELLRTASSDCSHFELSSEKVWKTEYNSVPASKIFNLDLHMLSKGLACVPFYERLGLDVSELTVEEKESFDRAAKNNWEEYNFERNKIQKKINEWKPKNSENSLKAFEDSVTFKSNLEENVKENQKTEDGLKEIEVKQEVNKNMEKEKIVESNSDSHIKMEPTKKKIFLSETDENLEDWLDSVLDD